MRSKNLPSCRLRRGLSFLELLVCIAVLGVLALLCLPAMKAVRENGRALRCASMLRELWRAGIAFTQDHDGRFCSLNIEKSSSDAKSPGFREYLGYTKNQFENTLYSCPTAQSSGTLAGGGNMCRSYSVNRLIVSNWAPGDSGTTIVNGALERLTKIPFPSKTLYITDGVPNVSSTSPTASGKGINYYSNINASNAEDANYLHSKRLNAVFVDGHVAALEKEALQTSQNNVLWGGTAFD